MFHNSCIVVSLRTLTHAELMAIGAQEGSMIQYHDPRATSRPNQSTQVEIENVNTMNPSINLNTLKQDVKPSNMNKANQIGTELFNQNCYEIEVDPSQSTNTFKKKIVPDTQGTSKLDISAGLNATVKNDENNSEKVSSNEEIKHENNILTTIKNDYLNSHRKRELKPDGTLIHHRWGKKQDVNMFKLLRQI